MSLVLIRALLWAACLFLVAASAATDLRDRIIPNRFVIMVAVAGLVVCVVSRPELAWLSIFISAVVFLSLGTLTHFGFLGGGDSKLISALTLFVAPGQVGLLLIEIVLAGGLLSIAYLVGYGALRRMPHSLGAAVTPPNATHWLKRFIFAERERIATGQSVPYALAILAGVIFHIATELHQCFYAISCSL
jgi:prepilin peptidase CpaA